MKKEVGIRAKKNHLIKYLNEHFSSEEFEKIEDKSNIEDAYIKLQTKSRIITISSDKYGDISEEFKMRRGAGTKADYLKKQEAYIALNTYLKLNFPEDSVIKTNSFEDSLIKIQTEEKIISLLYDEKRKEVFVKERMRRGKGVVKSKENTLLKEGKTFNENKTIINSEKHPTNPTKKTNPTEIKKTESEERIDELIKSHQIKQVRHKKLKEDTMVKNKYNGCIYRVLDDDNGLIKVTDNTKITYQMTIADLEIVSE